MPFGEWKWARDGADARCRVGKDDVIVKFRARVIRASGGRGPPEALTSGGNNTQIVPRAARVLREGGARRRQQSRARLQESDRLALQLELPPLVLLEDRPRAGAERAMIEKDHIRAQQELVPQI